MENFLNEQWENLGDDFPYHIDTFVVLYNLSKNIHTNQQAVKAMHSM